MTATTTETPAAGDPVGAGYRRLAAVHPALRIRTGEAPADGGWVRGSALAADPRAVQAMIDLDSRAGARDHGVPLRPDVAAGFSLRRYVWPVALAFTVPWFLERRVPRLPPDRVAINRSTGELAVRPVELVVLPDDPLAPADAPDRTGPAVRVVPDGAALRAELRAALAEHLAPVLAAFRPRVRRGPRTLWGMVTDDVVEGLWYLGAPFVGSAGFRHEDAMRTRTRTTCCLFYTVRPEEPCFTCPRRQSM
jgi:hypothetical protein